MYIIRVLLVDDHSIVRAGFNHLLSHADDINVIAEAESGEEAIQHARELAPDVIVMDIDMPGMGGIEAIRRISGTHPKIKLIALTAHEHEPFPTQVLKAGGRAFLSKRCAPAELVSAVRATFLGQKYITNETRTGIANAIELEENPLEDLTRREFQIFNMLAQGMSITEAAQATHLAYQTVYAHHTKLKRKLGIKNQYEIIKLARHHGVVQ